MLEELAAGAGAAVGGIGGALVNQFFADSNRKKEVKAQKKLMDYSNQLAQQSQVNSASNMAEGYDKAGLSKALLAGGNFSPAIGAAPSAPQKNVEASFPIAESIQLAMMKAQKDNIEAQTAKTEAETQSVENENETYDSTQRWIDGFVQQKYPDIWQKFHDDPNNGSQLVDIGFIRAHKDVYEALVQDATSGKEINEAERDAAVADVQKRDPQFVDAVARLPVGEATRVWTDVVRLQQMTALMEAQEANTDASTIKLQRECQQIFRNMVEQSIENPALATVLGDTPEMVAGTIQKTVGFAADIAKMVFGIKTAKSVAGAAGMAGYVPKASPSTPKHLAPSRAPASKHKRNDSFPKDEDVIDNAGSW